jgi:hypothetical protein
MAQRRSGGPQTTEGKAVVSTNALKHGLRSVRPVLDGIESEEEWQSHRQGIVRDFEPEGYLETYLAELIAELLWRWQRAVRFEKAALKSTMIAGLGGVAVAEIFRSSAVSSGQEMMSREDHVAHAVNRSNIPGKDDTERLVRYEAHLSRQFYRALHELEALQARRHGKQTPLARLEVHGLDTG